MNKFLSQDSHGLNKQVISTNERESPKESTSYDDEEEIRDLVDVYKNLPDFKTWEKHSSKKEKYQQYCSLVMQVASLKNDNQMLKSIININNLTLTDQDDDDDE